MYIFYFNDVPLPVTPSKLEIKISNKNRTVDLINGSEVTLAALPGLSDISFSFMLPRLPQAFSIYNGKYFRSHYWYIAMLERLKTSCEPFRFYVVRSDDPTENTSMNVTLEDYTYTEDAEDGSDITVKVSLKQYADYVTKIVTIFADGNPMVAESLIRRPSNFTAPESYTVKDGDTLWEIAKVCYGDGELWSEIYKNNYYVIETAAIEAGYPDSFNGNLIVPGTVLSLVAQGEVITI